MIPYVRANSNKIGFKLNGERKIISPYYVWSYNQELSNERVIIPHIETVNADLETNIQFFRPEKYWHLACVNPMFIHKNRIYQLGELWLFEVTDLVISSFGNNFKTTPVKINSIRYESYTD